ncbi:hypothetical protein M408DRAFT_317970 [Serendipita vermifera MAFF 305830]|uniref:Uncharacterized protein n=1 Tax=Serendipita vermifera MAFF 305830 TaxID=933852 RepID=A0A0C3BHX2_SERVB|nr:hypothetical protein M408DRAFT_317970 [Serendipita vermifera MAFF 305830]
MPSDRRGRSRSNSSERLPRGVEEISEKDFFLKNDEFQRWLKEEKDKYFTELSGDKARSYFRKFVKSWNKGRLSSKYYQGAVQETASSSTSYKWAFASSDRVSEKEIRGARDAVRDATSRSMPSSDRPVQGPSLPGSSAAAQSASDKQWERETLEEKQERERRASRKRARMDEEDRIEDAIGPREVGRERLQENKRARRENDRSFREKDNEPDIDADSLMGGDSFQARLAQRDAAKKRFEEKRNHDRESREQANRERVDALKQKDKATMEMFKALAKERFG